MSVRQQYTREMRDETNYLPTWLPTVRVSLGDVGRITDYQYTQVGTLIGMNINFEKSKDNTLADIGYASAQAVSTTVKLAGQIPPLGSAFGEAEAGISIKFARENAVIFRASGCRSVRIENLIALEEAVLARYQAGNWEDDLVVVTEVIYANSATVIISSSANASIDLKANGNIHAANFHIANAEANFQAIRETDIDTKIIAQSLLTPLIRTAAIRKRLFRGRVVRGDLDNPAGEQISLADVDYEDFAHE